ncbi:MAG: TRAP transporter substrate-binding protein [Deltaproteobacteria bacterium]|nr:TRAP transporter substrate-binding protein [Deltaproteobacteria bacterium]
MKKGIFFGVLAGVLAGLLAVADTEAVRAQTIELKLAHFMSPMHVQHVKSFEPFAKRVGELTGGKVTVKVFPGGALGGPTQLPDGVKAGITDIAFIIPSYTTGRFVRMSALDLPFLFNSAVHTTKVIYDVFDKYIAADFKDYKVLWLYSCGPGQLHSATKPLSRPEELRGTKVRAPSAYMSKALTLLGANPVSMPISELTVSLQKGVIDGMLTPFSALADFRCFDLVKHIAEVDFYVSPMAVVMNKEKFASLPDSAKKAIDQASGKAWGLHAAKVYDEHDQNSAKEGSAKHSIKIVKITGSELQKFKDKVKIMEADWVKDVSQKGIPGKEILDAVRGSAGRNK